MEASAKSPYVLESRAPVLVNESRQARLPARVPVTVGVQTDTRDLVIVAAYLRLKSCRKTALETGVSHETVSDVVNGFASELKRAKPIHTGTVTG